MRIQCLLGLSSIPQDVKSLRELAIVLWVAVWIGVSVGMLVAHLAPFLVNNADCNSWAWSRNCGPDGTACLELLPTPWKEVCVHLQLNQGCSG